MDGVQISQEDKVSALVSISGKMGVLPDEMLAVYLVLGDGLFFLLDLFSDRTIKFSSLRSLRKVFKDAGSSYRLQRLKKSHYVVNGTEEFRENIKRGDVVSLGSSAVVALGVPQDILGEVYILCRSKEGKV
jgi:hypothetical protein